jgi:hypothetical protein
MTKQLTAAEVARTFGLTQRHWTRLAASGKVPGARQPAGPSGKWLFDAAVFERWWKSREVMRWPAYSVEAEHIGLVSSVRTESYGEASRQRTEQRLRSVLGHGPARPSPLARSDSGSVARPPSGHAWRGGAHRPGSGCRRCIPNRRTRSAMMTNRPDLGGSSMS